MSPLLMTIQFLSWNQLVLCLNSFDLSCVLLVLILFHSVSYYTNVTRMQDKAPHVNPLYILDISRGKIDLEDSSFTQTQRSCFEHVTET